MKWFKHDTNANMDAKIQEVLLDYGLEGYGLYWYCLEMIAGKVDAKNITFELEHDARVIAKNTGSTPQKVSEMMSYFTNLGLFENTGGTVSCLKLAKRLDQSMTSSSDMRKVISTLKSHDGVMINHDKTSKSHDGVMMESRKPMQDKIRLDKKEDIRDSDESPSLIDSNPKTPYAKIIEIYHEVLPNLPRVAKETPKRKSAMKARHIGDLQCDLGQWRKYFEKIRSINWMSGGNDRNWIANFDYLIKQETMIGVAEGTKNDR